MIEELHYHLQQFDFDVRKRKDARYIDQKVTPDVLSIIADCVLNFDAGRTIEFTKNDVWNDNYFNINVKGIFNKPDAQNENAKREYDKFTSQPLRALAYSGVLTMHKVGRTNQYLISNRPLLEFIGMKERNAYNFLYHYLVKVLHDSDLLRFFEDFKKQCLNGSIDSAGYSDLKTRFQRFMIGNTPINGTIEVNRIFPKILNIYASYHNIQGSLNGYLSKRQIYYTDLMYNRPNWRDIDKNKNISRAEVISMHETLLIDQNKAYSDYQVQKAMNLIRKMYKNSEVNDQWSKGEATQVHHIFPKAAFPQLAHYPENLIKLTPTQHFTKAHPNNSTQHINKTYQLVCLLAKTDSIEQSLNRGEFIYRKESFIHVINTALKQNLSFNLNFKTVKQALNSIYCTL